MIHSFDTIVAKKVGINSAVILNNLYYWIEKNKANEKNYYDGYYWTYNSKKAFGELFPYFTTRQIDYAIKKLIDDGYVITGNYNKIAYDRTLWYAITEKGYELLTGNTSNNSVNPISQNCKMDETKLLNGNHEIIGSFAGDMEKAHEKGCDFVRSLASVNKVDCDIAISTNGGYPLDQNMYQSVKGMTAAESAAKA